MIREWLAKMSEIEVDGKRYALTDAGFLVDREAWSEALGTALAARSGVELSAAHWEIIHFIREYYRRFEHLPNNRVFVKAVHKQLGEEKGNSRYLHRLFPDGPLKLACLIGGLPKPSTCL